MWPDKDEKTNLHELRPEDLTEFSKKFQQKPPSGDNYASTMWPQEKVEYICVFS